MSSLDEMVIKQKDLINKGYEIDNIRCAALLLVAERLGEITDQLTTLLQPTITHEPMPKIGPSVLEELEIEIETGVSLESMEHPHADDPEVPDGTN